MNSRYIDIFMELIKQHYLLGVGVTKLFGKRR